MNQIIYEPDYKKILYGIISEYSNIEDYEKDSNDYFNNIYIIFYTKSKPDSIRRNIYIKNKYYMTMSIKEIRDIIKKCYDSDEFSNELLVNVVKYLPSIFFNDLNLPLRFKSKYNINIPCPRFIPNNRDNVLILDDLEKLNDFIERNRLLFFSYEFNKLCNITIRLNISKNNIENICKITNNFNYSSFILKENKELLFDNSYILNDDLKNKNLERQNIIKTLYRSTKNESYLSNDVLYKVLITRNLEDWYTIINNCDFIANNEFIDIINKYKFINFVFNKLY